MMALRESPAAKKMGEIRAAISVKITREPLAGDSNIFQRGLEERATGGPLLLEKAFH
jgi:hypothetical protein